MLIRQQASGSGPEQKKKSSRWRKRVLAGLGVVLTAFVGAVVSEVVGESGLVRDFPWWQDDPAPTYEARVIRSPYVLGFATPAAGAVGVHRFRYDNRVEVTGYCIGRPVRDRVTGVLDERWLVSRNGLVLSAAHASFDLPADLGPQPCPGADGEIGGPRSIRLDARRSGGRLLLDATVLGASTVGFALFDRDSRRWRSVAMRLGGGPKFAASVAASGAPVALAVACWGPMTPAHPEGVDAPVKRLAAVGDGAPRAVREAAEKAANGALVACSRGAYGVAKPAVEPTGAGMPVATPGTE
ncbi:MAG: hypothetical protein ABW196_00815, partial [Solirubrobacterales bacterium]